MRGLLFLLAFLSSLPFIFISPFNGVLIWYVFSLGHFHTMTWGFLGDLYYAWIVSILTCFSWLLSRVDPKRLPLTPLVVLTLLFALWMTITSLFALGQSDDVWQEWTTDQKLRQPVFLGLRDSRKDSFFMTNKDAFDLWWEWADKPVDNKPTIDAAVYDAVMALPPDERRDRAKVNAAVRKATE